MRYNPKKHRLPVFQTSGVLLVDMGFGGIEQVCRDVELSNGGYLYLVDGDGELIYHPRMQLIDAGIARLEAASKTEDAEAIKAAIAELTKDTGEFAARRMDRSIREALSGRSVDSVIE